MRMFYFISGPKAGKDAEFFRRLEEMGGSPRGWQVYPHMGDNRALHIAMAESEQEIRDFFAKFQGLYDEGEIVEVRELAR